MNLNSKYFDRIRVKPDADPATREHPLRCAQPGCKQAGTYPAPKGRGREGEFFHFCLDHVREYNKRYNYFNGMSDDDVARYQAQAATGHRPTWSSRAEGGPQRTRFTYWTDALRDPFGFFAGQHARHHAEPHKPVHNAQRKALDALNLDAMATPADIKARYKALVKRHHPDANGGDTSSQDRLREIIQAYTYLKREGSC